MRTERVPIPVMIATLKSMEPIREAMNLVQLKRTHCHRGTGCGSVVNTSDLDREFSSEQEGRGRYYRDLTISVIEQVSFYSGRTPAGELRQRIIRLVSSLPNEDEWGRQAEEARYNGKRDPERDPDNPTLRAALAIADAMDGFEYGVTPECVPVPPPLYVPPDEPESVPTAPPDEPSSSSGDSSDSSSDSSPESFTWVSCSSSSSSSGSPPSDNLPRGSLPRAAQRARVQGRVQEEVFRNL